MRSSLVSGLLLLVTVALALAAAGAWWFVCDDAFISYRYARNWASGHGLVYNPGEAIPVEGYSNFLWVALAALLELVGVRPAAVLPAVSMGCGAALLVSVYRAAQDRLGYAPPAALAAAITLAAAPGFVVWSTSGLETMPTSLLLWLTFQHWVLPEERADARRGALAALGLALIRTEGIGWVLVIAALAALRRGLERDRDGRIGRALLAVLAIYGVYFAARYAWFGTLLANTASAKVDADPERFTRGLDYVLGFWLEYLAGPVQLLCLPLAIAAARWRGLLVGAVAFGVPLYAVLVGGDFMTMGRLLVPGLAFGALLVGGAVQAAWRAPRPVQGLALTAALGLAAVGTLPLADVQLVPDDVRRDFRVRFNSRAFRTEAGQWRFMRGNARAWTKLGIALDQVAEPGDSIVLGAIGAVGYHADVHVFDRYGLVSREVVERGKASRRRQSPGHDMLVPATFFLDQDPTFLWADYFPGRSALRGLRGSLSDWRSATITSKYGPELHEVNVEGEDGWLLVLRRMKRPEQAWSGLEARVAELGGTLRR